MEVLSYCKELLDDESAQLDIDAVQNQIYFLGLYPITIETMQMIQGYLMSGVSLILTYVATTYMGKKTPAKKAAKKASVKKAMNVTKNATKLIGRAAGALFGGLVGGQHPQGAGSQIGRASSKRLLQGAGSAFLKKWQ